MSCRHPAIPGSILTFIGIGKMNRHHLGFFLGYNDVQVVCVCDVDTTRREHAKKTVEDHYGGGGTYKGCDAQNDSRKVLGRKDVDAVVIATPDHWHAIPVIEACKAQKDIYCEKPLSLTIHEARVMIDDVHLYESPGHHRDWLNCIRTRKRPICDVEIGARSVTVCHLGNLAYWYGRKLRWDPQNWQFIGDDEANTWLDRQQRDPWQLPDV